MSAITRREFAAILGFVTLDGALTSLLAQSHGAAATPASRSKTRAKTTPAAAPVSRIDRSIAAPDEIWAEMMEGNRRFALGTTAPRDVVAARASLAHKQEPFVIVLTCADSRLSPELIFDQNLGDLFVVRTAGNVADPIALASMEYAIEHLHSRMLVVLGHENCGAVAATLADEEMPTENLTALVGKIRSGVERLKTLVRGETLMELAVQANVHHSAAEVIKGSPIVQHGVASNRLTIVKALYKLGTGEVIRLGAFNDGVSPTVGH